MSYSSLEELAQLKQLFGVGAGDSGHELNVDEFVRAINIARSKHGQFGTNLNNNLADTHQSEDSLECTAEIDRDSKELQSLSDLAKESGLNAEMKMLFRRIDANSDQSVDWNEFTNYLLLEEQGSHNLEMEAARCEICPQDFKEPKQNSGNHHRELIHTIIKLKSMYMTSSGDGELKLWDVSNLAYRRTIDHGIRVTATSFVPGPSKIVVASVDRCLTFYETTTFYPCGKFSGLQDVPQTLTAYDASVCMGTWASMPGYKGSGVGSQSSQHDVLLWGDDGGKIHGLRLHHFKIWHVSDFNVTVSPAAIAAAEDDARRRAAGWQPNSPAGDRAEASIVNEPSRLTSNTSSRKASNESKKENGGSRYTKKGLIVKLGPGVDHVFSCQLFKDWVTKIRYYAAIDVLVASSLDGRLRFFDLERNNVVRTCYNPQGKAIHDFVYCPGATTKFIASSSRLSRDVCLWNPHSGTLHATLSGHTNTVQCLAWDSTSKHLVSLDKDKAIKSWDLSNYRVAQTVVDISMYRPVNVLSAIIHDVGTLFRGGTRPPRLVTASNRLCVWPISSISHDRTGHSHLSPLVGAVYSSPFQQVVTADINGSVQVWDVCTGKLCFKFNRVHGKNATITSICLDSSERRLITAGDDASVRIWNFSNGQCLRECITRVPNANSNGIEESSKSSTGELVAVSFIVTGGAQNKFIITGGWDRRVFIFPDIQDRPKQYFSRCMPALYKLHNNEHKRGKALIRRPATAGSKVVKQIQPERPKSRPNGERNLSVHRPNTANAARTRGRRLIQGTSDSLSGCEDNDRKNKFIRKFQSNIATRPIQRPASRPTSRSASRPMSHAPSRPATSMGMRNISSRNKAPRQFSFIGNTIRESVASSLPIHGSRPVSAMARLRPQNGRTRAANLKRRIEQRPAIAKVLKNPDASRDPADDVEANSSKKPNETESTSSDADEEVGMAIPDPRQHVQSQTRSQRRSSFLLRRERRQEKIYSSSGSHSDDITAICFCRTAGTVATGGHDGFIVLWDFENGAQRFKLAAFDDTDLIDSDVEGNAPRVRRAVLALKSCEVAGSSSINLLVSSGQSHKIRLWNVRHGTCLATLPTFHAHTEWISTLAFEAGTVHEQGNIPSLLSSGGSDGTMMLWDMSPIFSVQEEELKPSKDASRSMEPPSALLSHRRTRHTGRNSILKAVMSMAKTTMLMKQNNEKEIADRFRSLECLAGWQAHASNITSISFVIFKSSESTNSGLRLLVSASSDQTAILWDHNGHKIGMFGQAATWNILNPKTWGKECPTLESIAKANQARKKSEMLRSAAAVHGLKSPGSLRYNNENEKRAKSISFQSIAKQRIMARRLGRKARSSMSRKHESKNLSPGIKFSVERETERLPKWQTRPRRREAHLGDGWGAKVGRQTTDIWMRLKTSGVVSIPSSYKSFMHRSHRRRNDER